MREPGADVRPTIWIVDDSSTQAAFTERTLGASYRFAQFSDGTSVIEQLVAAERLPDLLLLDWVMPGMSGDEVCRYLRGNPQTAELPIVILTASRTETADIVHALESGANDYLAKPFVAEELHARVGSILRAAHLKRVADKQQRRVRAMNDLASALLRAGASVDRILDAVAGWFVDTLGDACALTLFLGHAAPRTVVRHRGSISAAWPQSPAREVLDAYIEQTGPRAVTARSFIVRDLGHAEVLITRASNVDPFDASDALTIETCLEYSSLAIEAAVRSEKERATTRFLEEMVGIVAHDLRNPLSAMNLGLDYLRVAATPQTETVLARIDRSSHRMEKIIDQLLDVTRSRIGAGLPVTLQPTQLHSIITPVIDELRMVHKTTDFVLTGQDVMGHWDRDRLEQVVSNLANNATLYGRLGGPVRMETSHTASHAELVIHNELRDAPIDPALIGTLFDPFERGRDGSNPNGVGLGLYIVQEIVRSHGGTIIVESDLSGTRFRVSLPRRGPPALA